MRIIIANPIGSALGQLISPLVGTSRDSVRPFRRQWRPTNFHAGVQILVLAIISSAVIPLILLVKDSPPTPPTYAAAQDSPSFGSFIRAMAGREPKHIPTYMSLRQRLDFAILATVFGMLVAAYVFLYGCLAGSF